MPPSLSLPPSLVAIVASLVPLLDITPGQPPANASRTSKWKKEVFRNFGGCARSPRWLTPSSLSVVGVNGERRGQNKSRENGERRGTERARHVEGARDRSERYSGCAPVNDGSARVHRRLRQTEPDISIKTSIEGAGG